MMCSHAPRESRSPYIPGSPVARYPGSEIYRAVFGVVSCHVVSQAERVAPLSVLLPQAFLGRLLAAAVLPCGVVIQWIQPCINGQHDRCAWGVVDPGLPRGCRQHTAGEYQHPPRKRPAHSRRPELRSVTVLVYSGAVLSNLCRVVRAVPSMPCVLGCRSCGSPLELRATLSQASSFLLPVVHWASALRVPVTHSLNCTLPCFLPRLSQMCTAAPPLAPLALCPPMYPRGSRSSPTCSSPQLGVCGTGWMGDHWTATSTAPCGIIVRSQPRVLSFVAVLLRPRACLPQLPPPCASSNCARAALLFSLPALTA
jgi:hypothetical protein